MAASIARRARHGALCSAWALGACQRPDTGAAPAAAVASAHAASVALAAASAAPAPARPAPSKGPTHPLDRLSASEFSTVVKLLQDAKLADDKSFFPLIELFEPDPGFVAGLAPRSFKPADVVCLPLTAGNFLQQAEEGKRLMKLPCYQNPSGSNFYAEPIEGLLAEVDQNRRKVSRIIDEGVVTVAKDGWGYTEAEIAKRARIRPVGNPVEMTQSKPNFTIKGSAIEWDIWRHCEIFAQSDKLAVYAEGRAKTELVVRSASEVGNYDYLEDHVFGQNGSINIDLIATGLDAVKGMATQHLKDATAAKDTQYGSLIAPNLVAPNHEHYFNFRLDFDIDGTDNSFVKTSLDRGKAAAGALRKSYWVAKPQAAASELEGRLRVDTARPALYSVINPNKQGVYGHHPGGAILPRDTATNRRCDYSAPPFKRNAYIGYSFWNTLHAPHKRCAGGKFTFARDGSDTLATWVQKNRPIQNKDIVTCYTIGFHHVAHTGDWPVVSGHKLGIELRPYNFAAINPAITLPASATPAAAAAASATAR